MPLTLPFHATNPGDTARLRGDQECRVIAEALLKAWLRDAFTLEAHWAVRGDDLHALFLRCQPHIVHFSGH